MSSNPATQRVKLFNSHHILKVSFIFFIAFLGGVRWLQWGGRHGSTTSNPECRKKRVMKMEGWVGSSGLTFRLRSSPGGLSGSIIFRYSSLESLCSDFPSRSAVWSRQAASCAYSCLRVIERGHRRTGAHHKKKGGSSGKNGNLHGAARAVRSLA